MTNRTVQIYGYGFGLTDATMTVTLNGTTIFSGAVTTTNQPAPTLPDLNLDTDTVPICSFELPVTFNGTQPMTCQVTNGTIIFAQILANYATVPNPIYSPADLEILNGNGSTYQERYNVYASYANPPFTQDETNTLMNMSLPFNDTSKVQILQSHNLLPVSSSGPSTYFTIDGGTDPRSDVTINNSSQTQGVSSDLNGTKWYLVQNGSTLAYTLNVIPGTLVGL